MPTVTDAAAAAAADQSVAALASAQRNSLMDDTQDRFMTLLVTQLQNQDPLNPMDNAEVTSQIAQLSTVNGIQQLNNTLLALSGQMDMSQSLQAANLIGKDILYPGDRIKVGGAGSEGSVKSATPYGIDFLSPAAKATVTILDDAGKAVYSEELSPTDAGIYSFTWGGQDSGGVPVPDGAYHVQVKATDAKGQPVSAQTLTYGRVGSVAYTTEGLKLNLAAGDKISLLDVRQVM